MFLNKEKNQETAMRSRDRGVQQLQKDPAPARRGATPRSTSQLRIDSKSLSLKPPVMANFKQKGASLMGRKYITFVVAPFICMVGLAYGQGWLNAQDAHPEQSRQDSSDGQHQERPAEEPQK